MAGPELTEQGSHRATAIGAGPGGIVEPGQAVPAGIPVGSWMEPVESEGDDLSKLKKAELLEIAEAEGVEVETDDNKADLVRKIEAARG